MFAFSIVKKIGEGNYLAEDLFIIERVRRERALNAEKTRADGNKHETRFIIKNERIKPS